MGYESKIYHSLRRIKKIEFSNLKRGGTSPPLF
jgi:hypothetical protein